MQFYAIAQHFWDNIWTRIIIITLFFPPPRRQSLIITNRDRGVKTYLQNGSRNTVPTWRLIRTTPCQSLSEIHRVARVRVCINDSNTPIPIFPVSIEDLLHVQVILWQYCRFIEIFMFETRLQRIITSYVYALHYHFLPNNAATSHNNIILVIITIVIMIRTLCCCVKILQAQVLYLSKRIFYTVRPWNYVHDALEFSPKVFRDSTPSDF